MQQDDWVAAALVHIVYFALRGFEKIRLERVFLLIQPIGPWVVHGFSSEFSTIIEI